MKLLIFSLAVVLASSLGASFDSYEDTDEYDPNWVLYGERSDYTVSQDQANFDCTCAGESEQKIIATFETSAITLDMLIGTDRLGKYCLIRKGEETCRLARCRVNTLWSMAQFMCTHPAMRTFQLIGGCLRSLQSHAVSVCHGNCWKKLKNFHSSSAEELNKQSPIDMQEYAKECFYQDCFLRCQKLLMRNKCDSSIIAVAHEFLRSFIGNRTQVDAQRMDLPKDCHRLIDWNKPIDTDVSLAELRIQQPQTQSLSITAETKTPNIEGIIHDTQTEDENLSSSAGTIRIESGMVFVLGYVIVRIFQILQ